LDTDVTVKEDVVDSSAMQLSRDSRFSECSPANDSSVVARSSKTLQPQHSRLTDLVHRTRDAGFYAPVFILLQYYKTL